MQTYEIRLLKADDSLVMIHVSTCETDDEARTRISDLPDTAYARYQIWQGMRLVAEGGKPD